MRLANYCALFDVIACVDSNRCDFVGVQETALNHVKNAGLLDEGFGATPEMSKKNLIWVVTKMQVLVEHYPKWLVFI